MAAITYYTGDQGLIANRISFDATLNENHEGTAEVTEHNVERGADLADHIRPNRPDLSLTVMITNTPIESSGRLVGEWVPNVTVQAPKWATQGFQPREAKEPVIKTGPNGLRGPLSIINPGTNINLIGGIRIDTKVTPGQNELSFHKFMLVKAFQFADQADRLTDLWEAFNRLKNEGTLLLVSTRIQDYENMVIARVSAPVEARDSINFGLTFKQIGYADQLVITEVDKVKVAVKKAEKPKPQGPKETYEVESEPAKDLVVRLAQTILGYRSPNEVLAAHPNPTVP